MKKNKRHYLLFAGILLWSITLTACGEIFEDMPPLHSATQMSFDRHAITLMQGDSCHLNLRFTPDSVTNKSAYWSAHPSGTVLMRHNGTIIGQMPGHTDVTATTVSHSISDKCSVNVFPRWEQSNILFHPYDKVIYAAVTVNGQPIDESHHLAAYVGDQLRGIGSFHTQYGIHYVRLRIYSPTPKGETVTLCYYDRHHFEIVKCSTTLTFDENTLGTLSHLYPIAFTTAAP